MGTVVTLATSIEQFDRMWGAVHNAKSDVTMVMVNKEALTNLLYDHSQLVGVIEEDKFEDISTEDGDVQATREALKALRQYRSIS